MKLTKIEKYIDDKGNCIEFFPEKIPGFSHRVIINGSNTFKWLSSDSKPNMKSAKYFLKLLLSDCQ